MAEETPENSQNTAIAAAFLCTVLFFGIFFWVLIYGPAYSAKLGDPFVAGVIAFICILPPFLPSLVAFVKAHLTGVSIAGFSFQFEKAREEFRAETYAGDIEVKQMASMQENQKDLAGAVLVMKSGSYTLMNMVEEIIRRKHEQCFVNLFAGHTWLPANLYFYVYHLSRKTLVRQVFFIETGKTGDEFIAMGSPREILDGLDQLFPEYRKAVDAMNKDSKSFRDSGGLYFNYLQNEYQDRNHVPLLWLNSKTLLECIGDFLHRDQCEPDDCRPGDYLHAILRNKYPYIAVIRNGLFISVVNRDELALKVARKAICAKR